MPLDSFKNKTTSEDLLFSGETDPALFGLNFMNNIYPNSAVEIRTIEKIGDISLITLKQESLDNTPLYQHLCIPPTEEYKGILKNALDILEEKHADNWNILKHFLKGLVFVKLNPEYKKKESQITSVTLPGIPYVSLISEKSFVHVPPKLILESPSAIALAENLIHEATHQWVNMNIVDNDIMMPDYSEEASPRVDIPWRSDALEERNRK